MSYTYVQKLRILFREYKIECVGIPELGRLCGKRIMNPKDAQFDSRIGDFWKSDDEEKHPEEDGRVQCLECAHIKTAFYDQKAKNKSKRLRGITKQGPKAKIANRGFSKRPDGFKHNWKSGRMEKVDE